MHPYCPGWFQPLRQISHGLLVRAPGIQKIPSFTIAGCTAGRKIDHSVQGLECIVFTVQGTGNFHFQGQSLQCDSRVPPGTYYGPPGMTRRKKERP